MGEGLVTGERDMESAQADDAVGFRELTNKQGWWIAEQSQAASARGSWRLTPPTARRAMISGT